MKLKYRIIKTNMDMYQPQFFEGVWIFGSWYHLGGTYGNLKSAEEYIIEYAHMVLASHDKVVREITVK